MPYNRRCGDKKRHLPHWWNDNKFWCDGKWHRNDPSPVSEPNGS